MKRVLSLVALSLVAFTLYSQNSQSGNGTNGETFVFSGELLGMYTFGFAGDDQVVPAVSGINPAGVFNNTGNGKNGYMTRMDFGIKFSPVSWTELFVKFRARSRVGNPYIPLTLGTAGADDFSLSFESAWGRINVVDALTFGAPAPANVSVWVKAGQFDSAPASFQKVSRFGTENVMANLRLGNVPSLQIEASAPVPFADSVSVIVATHQKFNEAITPVYDTDGSIGYHGTPVVDDLYAFPLFAALQLKEIATPLGSVQAEVVYALNAEGVFSGHNFGVDGRYDIKIPGQDNMTIPVGIGVALIEKAIDPLARTAEKFGNTNALFNTPGINPNHNTNFSTVSFRRSLRIGAGAGFAGTPLSFLRTEANIGYAYSQISHYYRDTIGINQISFDVRVLYSERFFAGGGIFLGTLGDVEWKSSQDISRADGSIVPNPETGFSHVFKLTENMGFEVYAGLNMGKSRFVLGYNMNKGLSMNNGIESMSEAQMLYLQQGTNVADGLFETGGLFAKLVISW